MPPVLTNVIFILFAAAYEVTPSVCEHNHNCQPSSRVKNDFVSHSCQTDLTMEDIAAMEARISVPTRPAFNELVTKSDDSMSFYPSALRAGGVLSSRFGQVGGCQTCGTHISVNA